MNKVRERVNQAIEDALQGGRDIAAGAAFVRKHPSLIAWGLIPAGLQTFCLLGSLWVAFSWLPERLSSFWNAPAPLLEPMYQTMHQLVSLLAFLLLLIVGVIVTQLLLSPIVHQLGVSIRQRLHPDESYVASRGGLLPAWVRSVVSIALWFVGQLMLLPLQLVPIFGGIAEITAGFAGSSLVMSREFMDVTLTQRGFALKQQFALLWGHRMRVVTLGAFGTVGLWCPGLNVLAFPVMAAAAAIVADELEPPDPERQPDDQTNDAEVTPPD